MFSACCSIRHFFFRVLTCRSHVVRRSAQDGALVLDLAGQHVFCLALCSEMWVVLSAPLDKTCFVLLGFNFVWSSFRIL